MAPRPPSLSSELEGTGENSAGAACGRPSSAGSSLPGASLLLVVLAAAIACANNFADPDLWMHILAGRTILGTGHIPRFDPYSYSAAGLPWHNHEWLAQVVLAISYGWLGIFGLKMLKLLCAAIVVSALANGIARTAAPPLVQRLVLLSTAAGLMAQIQFRPQLFTFAMFSIVMAVLAAEIYRGAARLWLLVPLFALWANFHGGYLVGLGALGICTIVVSAQDFRAERKITRGLRIAGVTLGCALATLLNPLGVGLWMNMVHSISDPLVRNFVTDWLPLARTLAYQWRLSKIQVIQYVVPISLFAGFGISLFLAPALGDAALTAVALTFICAAFYAARNIAPAVIALSIPLAHHLGLACGKRALSGRDQDLPASPSPFLVGTLALILAFASGLFSERLETWESVPSGAVAFMKSRGLHGNILNYFNWGNYLIWHEAPQSRVFVDGRCELVYPDLLLEEYLGFLYGWPGGDKLLDRYPHDFILIKPGTVAERLVSENPHWNLLYRDSVSVLFARSATPPTGHARVPLSHTAEHFFFP